MSTQARRNLLAALKAWKLEEKQDVVVQLNRWATNVFTILIEQGLSVPEIELLIEDEGGQIRELLTRNSSVRKDWERRSRELNQRGRVQDDPLGSTQNRLSALYRDAGIRRFMGITDPDLNLDLERLMDDGGILLVNLQPSDYLAEISGRMFGTMLMTEFFAAARRRKPERDGNPRPFYLYADEAQEYLTHDIARIFAQGRKMGLSLILAHQYLDQVGEEDRRILSALHNACKTKAVFGIGGDADAKALVHELWPGQIDLAEVKRIDYSVKFWQQYGRDRVITETEGHSSVLGGGHTDTAGVTIGSAGHPPREQSGTADSSTWTDTDQYSRAVADVPIYHQIPFLEGHVTPWSLEEQRQRLADALRGQYQRHCFFRLPDMQCRPLLVPKVEPVRLSDRRIDEYAKEIADKVGAVPADALDKLIENRHRALEARAREFAGGAEGDVHSPNDDSRRGRRPGEGAKFGRDFSPILDAVQRPTGRKRTTKKKPKGPA